MRSAPTSSGAQTVVAFLIKIKEVPQIMEVAANKIMLRFLSEVVPLIIYQASTNSN